MAKQEPTNVPKDWLSLFEWHQKWHYNKQEQFVSALKDHWEVVFCAGNGCFGKGTKVMLYDGGIIKVESVSVGDVLMGDDGTPRNVLRVVKGSEPLYEFKLKTGRNRHKRYVFNENHILCLVGTGTATNGEDYITGEIVEVTVKDYLSWTQKKKNCHAFYKMPVETYHRKVKQTIPPYILGVWLGDGDSNGAGITSIDEPIIKEFSEYLKTIDCHLKKHDGARFLIRGDVKWNNCFPKLLKEYGLIKNKHIPDDYLYGSKEQRLELLAGLLDTDGSYSKSSYDFIQKNKTLAKQVVILARSVGLHANINRAIKSCKYKGKVKTGEYWRISIGRNVEIVPCRLSRKQPDINRTTQRGNLHFGVKSVKPLGVGDYYGFTLDGNHRFLGSDFTVLRNTGKTHLMYWNLICYALGIHPYQTAPPPLTIKVLMYDYEHGYGKIFTETCLQKQLMPDGTTIPPMLVESPTMVKKWPSRDDRTIYFNNKSAIFFQTYEQKKRQHSGTNFDILGCDEEPPYQAYDESKRGLRTAKGGGRILHAFTPPFDEADKNKGPSWTKFKLIDPFEKGEDPDVAVIRACMKDNPAITDEFVRKFSKGKTEEQIRIQIYGEYPTWGELIFPDFEDFLWNPQTKTGNLLPAEFEVPWRDNDVSFEMAVDWHGSKPCAIVWTFEYMTGPNKGDVVLFDELSPLEGRKKTITDVCTTIREIEGWRKLKIKRWGDPKMRDTNNAMISGFSPWSEFRHCGIYLSESWNRDPYVGYSIVNDYLRGKGRQNLNHPRLFIRENCKTTRHNMKNHYNVPKGNGIAVPDPKFSDYCVNVKYIMMPKARKLKKNMERKTSKWPLTSNGSPYGPYGGTYIDPVAYVR